MSQVNPGSSPPQQAGDVASTNISADQAKQRLLEKYLPKAEAEPEKPKSEATDVGPAQEAAVVAEGTVTETPAQIEETPAEADAEAQATPEEGEDVLSHDTNLTPEEREKFKSVTAQWQEGVNKRIGKEKQKRLDAEAKAREYEEKLQQVQAVKPEPVVVTAPAPDNPLADVNDVQGLVAKEKEANSAIYQAQAMLDQLENEGQTEIKVGETTYTRQMLRDVRREAERALREHIPGRHRFLAQQAEFKQLVKRDIPEMLDPKSPMYKEAQQARLLYPQLNYLPNGDYLIGLALKGARSLAAEQANKGKKLPTTQKPPASQTVTSAAVSTQTRAAPNGLGQWEAEKKKVFAKGNVSGADAAALLLKREQLSTSR